MIPEVNRKLLLGSDTSRLNKIHLATGWAHFHSWYIQWRWAGAFLRSCLEFQFTADGPWIQAKSFDEDVLPTYAGAKA